MINVMLDPLPTEWRASDGTVYPIDTDFRIGVQLFLLQEDPDLSGREKSIMMQNLLFVDIVPANQQEIEECITYFLDGWYQDNKSTKKENKRIMSFDVDQWRIFSAFLAQYRIDLNEIEYLHFWKFMGLLTTLQDCSYTRVIDIRQRKFKPKINAEDRKQLKEAKAIYQLPELRSAEDQELDAEIFDFLGGTMSDAERKRVQEFEKYAEIDDEEE